MKSRMLVSMLVIALAAAVIGGATMAWFTDEAEVSDVTFTAGTVDIEVTNDPTSFENVNPGDCYDISATIKNEGSKAVVLKLDDIVGNFNVAGDAAADLALDMSLITIHFQEADQGDWTKSVDGNWIIVNKTGDYSDHNLSNYEIYYVGSPISAGDSVTLKLKVCFDGPGMNNDYQGATLTLDGTFYAVQASNGAPNAQWGVELYSAE